MAAARAASPLEHANTDAPPRSATSARDDALLRAEWAPLGLHAVLQAAVARLGFARPTPIQLRAVPAALLHFKDIIGAAETGSGKTLAYGLPIVHRLLDRRERLGMMGHDAASTSSAAAAQAGPRRASFSRLPALIFTPTRELALQVREHIARVCEGTPVSVVTIVGGLAVEKQTRLLRARPDIVVATPGRFWDILSTGAGGDFLSELHRLQVRMGVGGCGLFLSGTDCKYV